MSNNKHKVLKRNILFSPVIIYLWLFILISCKTDQSVPGQVDQAEVAPYREMHRPQYHFSPEKMWMNDPNGLVFFDKEYHLFYQYYPDSTVWGPMHWGHAISKDLIHWEHLPVALYPDSLGYIFSGSAVVDWKNTSGLGQGDQPPLIALFTHHNAERAKSGNTDYESQSLAYSNDKGRTWTKFHGNPVIRNPGIKDFRDPKVIWHEASGQWVLVLAAADRLHIYNSPDLIQWNFVSEFGEKEGNHDGVWECPDLFPLMINDKEKWVLIQNINPGHPNGGSGTQYFIGEFDGKSFINDNPPELSLWLDYGKDNYAGVTWSDAPAKTGQRIFIGWMSNWQYAQQVPTSPWRSAMTLPRTLQLVDTKAGLRLSSFPVPTVTSLRREAVAFSRGDHREKLELLRNVKNRDGLYELQLEFEKPTRGKIELEIFNAVGDVLFVGYDVDQNEYYVDRLTAGRSDFSRQFAGKHVAPCYYNFTKVKMHIFLDVSSIELFADDGRTVITEIVFPSQPYTDITLNPDELPLKMIRGRVFELSSIW